MRSIVISVCILSLACLFISPSFSAANPQKVPKTVGGFTLNSSIDDYPVESHANYLNEVIVTDHRGFRKGFITYGTCRNPGKILRIKLKYEDRSFKFFQELLKRYKKAFGSKPKFSGDQFGNVKSWKWAFTDENDQRVTLELQHNLKDTDESVGNMVKLSLPELMNNERRCFNERHQSDGTQPAGQSKSSEKIDWMDLIPN